jgi:hypothetical protein
MGLLTLVWGVSAFIAMVVGLTPVFWGLNWFTVPFAGLGIAVAVVALFRLGRSDEAGPIVAFVSNAIAMIIGVLRLRGGFGL